MGTSALPFLTLSLDFGVDGGSRGRSELVFLLGMAEMMKKKDL